MGALTGLGWWPKAAAAALRGDLRVTRRATPWLSWLRTVPIGTDVQGRAVCQFPRPGRSQAVRVASCHLSPLRRSAPSGAILTGLRDRLGGVDNAAPEARHAWEASVNAATEDELFAAWEAELLRKNRGKTRPRHANAE